MSPNLPKKLYQKVEYCKKEPYTFGKMKLNSLPKLKWYHSFPRDRLEQNVRNDHEVF